MSIVKNENDQQKDKNDNLEKLDDSTIEKKDIKCSLKEHNQNNAIIYCQECQIYMCKQCQNHHLGLFTNHHSCNLDKNNKDIFTGLCKEKTHSNRLDYYCKNHNQLCCVECLCIIQNNEKGQHKNCDVCLITEIKDTKKNILKENIIYLKYLSNYLQKSIYQLKIIFERKNKNKEELKLNIRNNFTQIKNILNERENELLIEIDKKFDEIYFKEDLIKQSEELSKKVNELLEKGNIKDIDWNDNIKLNHIINNCIIIENNIKNIKLINENIIKSKYIFNSKIKWNPDKDRFNKLLEDIKKFGEILDERHKEFIFYGENIDYQGLDKYVVEDLYQLYDEEYNLTSIMDMEEIIKKIIELKCDINDLDNWIYETL